MIGAIGGYDSIFSIGYSSRAAAVSSDFRVPESALTGPEAAEGVSSAQPYDPIQDSVELSRDYPQLVVGQTYAPPMEQQIAFAIRGAEQSSGMSNSGEQADYLNDSTVLYTGSGVEEQAAGEEQVNEEGNVENGEGDEEAAVDETGREQTDANGQPLSEEEQQQIKELSNTDREVRAHEQAHKSVGGAHAGAMSFEYQQGPDGQRYAVGGEVSIDISVPSDPSEAISKMQQVRSAAMAPANPSPQDYKVAAQAMQQEAQARQELSSAGAEGTTGEGGEAEAAEDVQGAESDVSGGGISSVADGEGSSSSASASGVTGGVASLRTNNNQYAQRYAQMQTATMESASGQFQFASAMGGEGVSSYRPINIVA